MQLKESALSNAVSVEPTISQPSERAIKSWKARSYQEEKRWGSKHSLGVNPKTVKKPERHHVGPRIRGSSITTDSLSQKRMNLVMNRHNAKTSLKSRMVNYISGNQVTFAALEERNGKSIELVRNPIRHRNKGRYLPHSRESQSIDY